MIKGAIFDMDGTLLDSMYVWDSVGENYLRSIGCQPEEGLKRTLKSMSLYQAGCYLQENYGLKLSYEEIATGINGMVEKAYRQEVLPKEGVVNLLEQLRQKNIPMCVATATDRYLVEAALRRCGILEFFSEIFTCEAVGHGKDEPVIFRQAQAHLGTEKAETAVFEDSLFAAKTAKQDGFFTVAVYDAYEIGQEQLRELSDVYLKDYEDLTEFWTAAMGL